MTAKKKVIDEKKVFSFTITVEENKTFLAVNNSGVTDVLVLFELELLTQHIKNSLLSNRVNSQISKSGIGVG